MKTLQCWWDYNYIMMIKSANLTQLSRRYDLTNLCLWFYDARSVVTITTEIQLHFLFNLWVELLHHSFGINQLYLS